MREGPHRTAIDAGHHGNRHHREEIALTLHRGPRHGDLSRPGDGRGDVPANVGELRESTVFCGGGMSAVSAMKSTPQ